MFLIVTDVSGRIHSCVTSSSAPFGTATSAPSIPRYTPHVFTQLALSAFRRSRSLPSLASRSSMDGVSPLGDPGPSFPKVVAWALIGTSTFGTLGSSTESRYVMHFNHVVLHAVESFHGMTTLHLAGHSC